MFEHLENGNLNSRDFLTHHPTHRIHSSNVGSISDRKRLNITQVE